MAPGAHLIVLKVLDGTGRGRISDVIAALDYVVEHKKALQHPRRQSVDCRGRVRVARYATCSTLAAKRAVEAGIVVVASAGNAGKTDSAVLNTAASRRRAMPPGS